jgi:predicted amidohydrolase
MRIACLQFAAQVGDIENNLDRADAVLQKAKTDELDGLDLLVLPELAFTGTVFSSSLLRSPNTGNSIPPHPMSSRGSPNT